MKKYNVKVAAVDSLSRKHKKKNKQNSNKKYANSAKQILKKDYKKWKIKQYNLANTATT